MTSEDIAALPDTELLSQAHIAVAREHGATAELVALLAEMDARRLYLGLGYSSLFTYCTQELRLSEPAAYGRIAAARAARRFPAIFGLLGSGEVSLTAVGLIAPHLNDENHEALLEASRRKSKREIEQLVASVAPQPHIPASLRRLPSVDRVPDQNAPSGNCQTEPSPVLPDAGTPFATARETGPSSTPVPFDLLRSKPARSSVTAVAPTRYLLRVTLGEETHQKLERARALLRHTFPDGDLGLVLDRALTLLLRDLERTRIGNLVRPRRSVTPTEALVVRSRYVPAVVRKTVWSRDGGQCAFVGTRGRCRETAFLEIHHVRPYADGGETTVDNLELRCRAHNQYEARLYFEAR